MNKAVLANNLEGQSTYKSTLTPFLFFCFLLFGCVNDKPNETEVLPPAEPFTFADGGMAEEMFVKKVVLARFEVKDGKIVQNETDPDWPNIDRHNLTVDDHGRIYVLNIRNAEILVFDDGGNFLEKIDLPDQQIEKTFPNAGYLETNGEGDKFLVSLPAIGSPREKNYWPPRQFVLDQTGQIIQEFSDSFSFPDLRLCDKTYFFMQAPYIYDENFNRISEEMPKYMDSEGNYDSYRGEKLIKYSREGKVLWAKQGHRDFSIKGMDGENHLYLTGALREGDSYSLYKIDSTGTVLSQAPTPSPFPFHTQEERDEENFNSSEELFSIFKLACNGNAYLIHQLGELGPPRFKRWLEKGEYFIYKFETKK